MSWTTRTDWIKAEELTDDMAIAGFGPISAVRVTKDGSIRVSNPFGCGRTYSAGDSVQRYLGVFDDATGRRVSMTNAEYKASIAAERAAEAAKREAYYTKPIKVTYVQLRYSRSEGRSWSTGVEGTTGLDLAEARDMARRLAASKATDYMEVVVERQSRSGAIAKERHTWSRNNGWVTR